MHRRVVIGDGGGEEQPGPAAEQRGAEGVVVRQHDLAALLHQKLTDLAPQYPDADFDIDTERARLLED